MRIIAFLLICFSAFSSNASAGIIVPWLPSLKVAVGIDRNVSVKSKNWTKESTDTSSDIMKFNNANAYISGRIFRYFGIESGFTRINTGFKHDEGFTHDKIIKNSYFDGKLFFPILSLGVIDFDGYISYGASNIKYEGLDEDGVSGSGSVNAGKYGVGIESSIVSIVSLRAGWYKVDKKLAILDNEKLEVGYVGIGIYLI